MPRLKLGDIYLLSGETCAAYLRPADGSPDIFLCSLSSDACRKRPHLQAMLIDLAAECALGISVCRS
jgi:hypothetical protein